MEKNLHRNNLAEWVIYAALVPIALMVRLSLRLKNQLNGATGRSFPRRKSSKHFKDGTGA